MSKEAALAFATGSPVPVPANPSIIGTPPPAAPPPVDMESARFAAHAKKEADLVKRQQLHKAELEDFQKRKTQVDDILKRRDQFEDTRKKDPVEALKLIGFSEQEIFNFLAAQEKKELTPQEIAQTEAQKAAKEEADKLRKELADEKAKNIASNDQALLGEYRSGLAQTVEANKEKFEYCAHYGPIAVDLAYRTVLQVVEDSKGTDIPTPEEAMQMIEDMYEEEDKALMSLKKRQSHSGISEVPAKPSQERSRVVSTPPGSTAPPPPIVRTRPLSNAARPTTAAATRTIKETPAQKRERLIAALRRGRL